MQTSKFVPTDRNFTKGSLKVKLQIVLNRVNESAKEDGSQFYQNRDHYESELNQIRERTPNQAIVGFPYGNSHFPHGTID